MMMVACMAMSVMAKELPKQGFGVQLGFAQPIVRTNAPESPGTLVNNAKLNGLKVGVVYDASYIAGFGSMIGFNYTFGNNKTKWHNQNLTFSDRNLYTYHQVELFVDWQYKFEVAKETYIILYTGPTLQLGISYKDRYELYNRALREKVLDQCTTVEHFKADEQDKLFRRLNITWGVGLGFQYKRYFLRGGYDFGLVNPFKNKYFVPQAGATTEVRTDGRIDQWNIRAGVYLWYPD